LYAHVAMMIKTFSQLRHNKGYIEKIEKKHRVKLIAVMCIAIIFTGIGLFFISAKNDLGAVVCLTFSIGIIFYSALVNKPVE